MQVRNGRLSEHRHLAQRVLRLVLLLLRFILGLFWLNLLLWLRANDFNLLDRLVVWEHDTRLPLLLLLLGILRMHRVLLVCKLLVKLVHFFEDGFNGGDLDVDTNSFHGRRAGRVCIVAEDVVSIDRDLVFFTFIKGILGLF